MYLKSFEQLIETLKCNDKKKVAVVAAEDEHALESVFKARNEGIVEPILIGNEEKIREISNKLNEDLKDLTIINIEEPKEAAVKAVELAREGKVQVIMKGKIQTADLLRAVVNKEKGLGTGRIMSHMAMHELPNYHKLLAVTDGGMMMYPNVQEKKQIIENAVDIFKAIGYTKPKVGILAAVENVNTKMPETVDADNLKQMNINGEITDCLIEGPISYDLVMSKESAEIKGYKSEIVADADILVVPNITTGNILGKSLVYSAEAKMAGFIIGAKVPIVLTSRGSTAEEKYLSLVLSASASK
ncbi:bifunctional enoyl-CoA hydratase/phosphate acetyltransferase [Clostridium intestinale]|uniref:bifunctional enoyl-CoA hydratase/phosphate acetyltransferase n=1 Tax=Clostridium intestinale TaxID=36845 RepID=UPI002DD63E69|nr:bifunctional enoyl-CoA hydratase/phosphate acetyltransferase [Clostridium intestinale]WRY51379.1 bifunctional enoyl-CoA hydratase/phosphate acetyltransferase [Clostridium intestinale]